MVRRYIPSDEHMHDALLDVEGVEYIKENAMHESRKGKESFPVPFDRLTEDCCNLSAVIWLGDDESILLEHNKEVVYAARLPPAPL